MSKTMKIILAVVICLAVATGIIATIALCKKSNTNMSANTNIESNLTKETTVNDGSYYSNVGDINADGKIDNVDVDLLFYYVSSKNTLSKSQMRVADVNFDGQVDNKDVVALYRCIN